LLINRKRVQPFLFFRRISYARQESATIIEILRAPPHTICVDTRDECYKTQQ
jgi:hypothetical protein